MTFPYHDLSWVAVLAFIDSMVEPGDTILGDDLFVWELPRVHRYRNTWLHPSQAYDWAIIHKGHLDRLSSEFLTTTLPTMHVAFANDVFVVWSSRPARDPVDPRHVDAFHAACAATLASDRVEPVDTSVLPDPGLLVRFSTLDDRALRDAMDAFWRHGGYEYPTHRDLAYNAELEEHLRDLAHERTWPRVLDLACGVRPLPNRLAGPGVVRGDLSVEAVRQARAADSDGRSFATLDGGALPFRSGCFDLVVLLEAIEHVLHLDDVLDEIARVTSVGGSFFVTAANRDSLHLRLARALGHPDHATNYQHITELTPGELEQRLTDRGFAIRSQEGVHLDPYWAIAGMPEAIGRAADEDPELVAALSDLGRRAGPTYAYTILAVAEKVR